MPDPKPGSRYCTNCGSYQITERRETPRTNFVVLKSHCNACRQDLIFWTGTVAEERKFKRNRRRVKKVVDAAARRLPGGGAH